MTNPRFEVLSVQENGKENLEATVISEWEAVQQIEQLVKVYGPTNKQDMDIGERITRLYFRQVWVLND